MKNIFAGSVFYTANSLSVALFAFFTSFAGSVLAQDSRATGIRVGQCIQVISSNPVFDVTLFDQAGTLLALVSRNSVPWSTLNCGLRSQQNGRSVRCTNAAANLEVLIGASHVAHLRQGTQELMRLPCIEPLLVLK